MGVPGAIPVPQVSVTEVAREPWGTIGKVEKKLVINDKEGTCVTGDVVVQARAHSSKRDLGESVIPVGESLMARGGQDACGAVVVRGGRIDAVLYSADGCSFGHRELSAKAARMVVTSGYQWTDTRLARGGFKRHEIQDELADSLKYAHKNILHPDGAPGGAAVAVGAAVHRERVGAREETYLSYAFAGDPNLVLCYRDSQGVAHVKRALKGMDMPEKLVRDAGYNTAEMTLEQIEQIADPRMADFVKTIARATGRNEAEVRADFESGIHSYLGGKGTERKTNSARVNLTKSFGDSYGAKEVTVIACSDFIGDKMSVEDVRQAYQASSGNNEKIAQELGKVMDRMDADDGNAAIATVRL